MPQHHRTPPASARKLGRRAFLALCAAGALGLAAASAGCTGQRQGGATAGSGATATDTRQGQVPASAREFQQISTTVFAFDTVVTLTACCARHTLDAAVALCNRFESLFSRTIATSDVGRINSAGGAPVQVASETADLVARALRYCRQSQGLFDITIGAVSQLWDFKTGVRPDDSAIEQALPHVDYRKVRVEGRQIVLDDPDARLDLGGIAKGYIADELARFLIDAGCDSACINLGGNVKTVGVKPDGSLWHVGIQDPNSQQGNVVAATWSHDTSVVTSGLYERCFEQDGRQWWHILDPRTGYPVQTDLMSATLISDASIDGDGLTKPLFMRGFDDALAWIDGQPGIEGLLQSRDGTIAQSRGAACELL